MELVRRDGFICISTQAFYTLNLNYNNIVHRVHLYFTSLQGVYTLQGYYFTRTNNFRLCTIKICMIKVRIDPLNFWGDFEPLN